MSFIKKIEDGQPCDHPGCLSHVTHACEGCGRIGGIMTKEQKTRHPFEDERPHCAACGKKLIYVAHQTYSETVYGRSFDCDCVQTEDLLPDIIRDY